MRFLMGALAENAIEVPLISRPYQLAVLPGRENIVAPLRVALDRLKNSGEFDRIVEQYLSSPVRRTWLDRYATILTFGGAFVLLLFVGGTAWNRSLHRQVQARTKAVERTERRYRDLVDNASDMIYRTDPFGRFTFVNPVATRILGFDEGELLSMKYFELMRPDWVPRAMGFYEKSAKTRESTYLEFPVRKKDGLEIWVGQHVRPIITGGRIEGFQGMARDITDRVNAQSELRAERDFVSAILDTAPSLIMVLDSQGQIVRFNRACEELSGVSMSEVAGQPVLGSAVPARRRARRDSRRHSAPGGVDRAGQARSDLGRQERRAAHDRVDGDGAARPDGRDVVPDRHGLRRHDGARARAAEVAVHLDGQPRAAHAADLDPRVDAAADRRRHDRQRRRRSARAGRAVERRSPDSHRQRHSRHVEDRGRRDDGVAEDARGCSRSSRTRCDRSRRSRGIPA